MNATRRDVLKIGGLGMLGAVGGVGLPWGAGLGAKSASELDPSRMPTPFGTEFTRPPVLRPSRSIRGADGVWVDHYSVTERTGSAALVAGARTPVWGYEGLAPGPTVNTRQGRRSVFRVRNQLPRRHPSLGYEGPTSVHLHGSASLPQYDGYASDVTPSGFYKDYHYPNAQRARTLWYHDHGVHHTATNAYFGLFAQYHLHDRAETELLPQGEFDVPLTVADAMFAADGSLAYDDNSTSGLWGDVILVNGRPWPVMKVKRRVYRFRVLNASISRSYRFALDNGDPVTVVATDGGLMPRARQVGEWRHSSAERYEVLIDFRKYRPGQRVVLRNLSNRNNVDYDHTDKVMAFDVTDEPFSTRDATWNRLPQVLQTSDAMTLTEPMARRTRRLQLERKNSLWTINGKTWDDVVRSGYQDVIADPDVGDVEIWELENRSGGWFHPLHIHLVDFRILDRNGRPPFDYERGPKDVAYVGENETVRVIMRFGPHRGRYMVHCHNLPHEDHDMMTQFSVGWRPGQYDPNDPMLAAPAQVDTLG
ncbi:MAG TPA: multicopper oxidase domain-containing protein [Nocardioidaceae bacterium]|nr:multicopper oxidase domain-containing protein [Nocardioidaceae bacterium]